MHSELRPPHLSLGQLDQLPDDSGLVRVRPMASAPIPAATMRCNQIASQLPKSIGVASVARHPSRLEDLAIDPSRDLSLDMPLRVWMGKRCRSSPASCKVEDLRVVSALID
jgi:hypothetical protein